MSDNVIAIETEKGLFQQIHGRVMRMVPDSDKGDRNLQRLLAFRLKIDGEAATVEYLMSRIREMIACSYRGSLYDFLKDDRLAEGCRETRG